jgi:hypothetical protein
MYRLPFVIETIARLLLPARSRKNLRPQLQGLCQGVEIVEMQKAGRLFASGLFVVIKNNQ